MTILILARDIDAQVDRVVEELGARAVSVFRTDLAPFPSSLSLRAVLDEETGWQGVLRNAYRSVNLQDIETIWYRHPSHFEFSERMSRPERRHAAAEARVAIAGILDSLDATWVNHPTHEAAMHKPRQLDVARRCGLRVPATLVTNTAESILPFAQEVGWPLAGKNLSAAAVVESGHVKIAYTRRLHESDVSDLQGIDTTAHLFQEFVDNKAFEVRATCVGSRIFAAAIHVRTETARIDFRADYPGLEYSIVEPPPEVRHGMHRFMETFGISFGAFDFAVTDDGRWIMFECNPGGTYGWLEDALGFPITSAVADLLVAGGGVQ